jgi:hypothetical protein
MKISRGGFMKNKTVWCFAVLALSVTSLGASSLSENNCFSFEEPIKDQFVEGGGGGSSYSASEFEASCDAYGFTISTDNWVPFSAGGFNNFKVYVGKFYDNETTLNYSTEIEEVLLKHVGSTNVYAFAYRILMSPLQVRHLGFLGIGSYGDDWSIDKASTKITLNSTNHLESWAPQNGISKASVTMGVGLDTTGPSISASVTYDVSELNISSSSNAATGVFGACYSIFTFYQQDWRVGYFWGPLIDSYTKNSEYYYGFMTFCTDAGSLPSLVVEHDITYYGVCWYHEVTTTYTHTY